LIDSYEVGGTASAPADAFSADDPSLFDWRFPGSEVSFEEAVTAPLAAVRRFLRERVPGPPVVGGRGSGSVLP
jgi:hypothetical protein